ncbi:hypothetical protein [Sediminibacter sp. Hel_I_10]|uniref:hypothetical protein n=1 Tax=Sediminibacter sp. Hel_I_10 TaxID=1392490 RepID=UPI0005657B19|nr:hypothetical protein [Sediminibacter sp. Hel_I_10]
MKKLCLYSVVLGLMLSCGPKTTASKTEVVNTTKTYVSEVESNTKLKAITKKGALTDLEGLQDIGYFTYTEYVDAETNALLRIKNVETTDKTITENYYFNNGELVLIKLSPKGQADKYIYTRGQKILSATNVNAVEKELYLNKAKRFKKAFYKG